AEVSLATPVLGPQPLPDDQAPADEASSDARPGPPVRFAPGPAGQPRAGQARAGQGRPAQGRPAQGRPVPARAAQVRAAQVRAAQRAGAAAPRLTASRPGYFPSGFAWLVVGVSRRWRGVFTALISTWLGVPFALFMAVLCAVLFGILGAVGGTAAGLRWVPPWVGQVPLLGSAVDSLLPSAGGVVGLLVGVLVGLLLGFLGALTLLWWTAFAEDPLTGFGALLLAAVVGVLVGLGYTLYRTTLEPTLLRGGGARRMS